MTDLIFESIESLKANRAFQKTLQKPINNPSLVLGAKYVVGKDEIYLIGPEQKSGSLTRSQIKDFLNYESRIQKYDNWLTKNLALFADIKD